MKIDVNEVTQFDLPAKLKGLKSRLSQNATIDTPGNASFFSNGARWGTYGAPSPGAVVNVAPRVDIVSTVCLLPSPKPFRVYKD